MPINTERLLQLAEFLETKMPAAKWDFANIMKEGQNPPAEAFAAGDHYCGTVGCAIGWTPARFPELVEWRRIKASFSYWVVVPVGTPVRVMYPQWDIVPDVGGFLFGLTSKQSHYLFMPDDPGNSAGQLTSTASAADVAAHIRNFVAELSEESHADIN